MSLPNFIIVGAARSGTTALHYLLQQHPQIYMSSNKEPHFFAFESGKLDLKQLPDAGMVSRLQQRSVLDLAQYEQLFADAASETVLGDASPLYLASRGAPSRIKKAIPAAKIIVILRNPVERAYSHFLQNAQSNGKSLNLDDEIYKHLDPENLSQRGRFYIALSQYYDSLSLYLEKFGRDQVETYLFEDLEQKSDQLLKKIFNFLDVDESVYIDSKTKYNASGASKFKLLETVLLKENPVKSFAKRSLPTAVKSRLSTFQNRIRNANLAAPTALPQEVRQSLLKTYFKEDILKLQTLLDKDLSPWLAS